MWWKNGSWKEHDRAPRLPINKESTNINYLQKWLTDSLNSNIEEIRKIPWLLNAIKGLWGALVNMLWQYYDDKISFETVESRLKAVGDLVSLEDVDNFFDNLVKGFLKKWENLFSGSPYKIWQAIGDIIFISITWGATYIWVKTGAKLVKYIKKVTRRIRWQNKLSSIWNMRNDYVFGKGNFYA